MSRSATAALSIAFAVLVCVGVAVAATAGGPAVGPVGLGVAVALVALAVNGAAFVPSYLSGTERFYDLTGALTYLSVTAVALTAGSDEPGTRALVVAGCVVVWALRLGTFLFVRVLSTGADHRFDAIKTNPLRFALAWTMQATWVVVTSAAALAVWSAPTDHDALDVWAVTGLAVWLVGFGIEVVADEQKRRFRAAGRPGGFISSGLWARSRHPNYFGEIVLWTGIALIALPTLEGWRFVALISPVFVVVLLTRISGIPMLEAAGRRRFGDDPAYRTYVERTPLLVPR